MLRNREIKIVIVEDDLYYNKVLKKYIETICNEKFYSKCKFTIKSYLTAYECIEELEDDTDLVLLDYYLVNENEQDNLTGVDVLDAVNEYCDDCKVIMISGQDNPTITEALREKGIVEYINKNLNSKNRVGSVVQRVLKEYNKVA